MAKDRSKTENNVIDFNQAKQKFRNIKPSTTVLEDLIEDDEEYYFEIEFDNDE
jgi:hypothetical protein|tara:strand:- start:588 stop:746 length:159 start_codon:yes stop_codon:yes gene_type:complete